MATLLARPLVLWTILILAFLAIWQLLNGSSGSSGSSTPAAGDGAWPSGPSMWSLAFVGGASILTIGWARWWRRRTRLFNEEASRALEMFRSADYTAAAERFTALAERYRAPANLRATAEFNLGMALLRSGDLARALEMLTALDRRMSRGERSFRATLASQLAAIYALRGEAAPADRWIAESALRLAGTGTPSRIDGTLIFTRLVNGVRRDDEESALQALDDAWETLEGTLPTAELRPFRALRAFATTRRWPLEVVAADPRVVTALAEVRPGELAWLGSGWPEMRAFLEATAPRR